MSTEDAAMRKQAMRRLMRSARGSMAPTERARAAAAIAANLLALPEMAAARTVMLFASFGSEVPTDDIVRRLQAEGRLVLLPYLTDAGGMEAAEVAAGEALVATAYGPGEPARRVAVDPAEVDIVVAPGLAFDRSGGRLGQGGGHYDRFLRRLGPRALRVGIAFAAQVVEEVPAEEGDERIDVLVTDAGVVDCRGHH